MSLPVGGDRSNLAALLRNLCTCPLQTGLEDIYPWWCILTGAYFIMSPQVSLKHHAGWHKSWGWGYPNKSLAPTGWLQMLFEILCFSTVLSAATNSYYNEHLKNSQVKLWHVGGMQIAILPLFKQKLSYFHKENTLLTQKSVLIFKSDLQVLSHILQTRG